MTALPTKMLTLATARKTLGKMESLSSYTLNVPESKVRLFRALAKEFGGTVVKSSAGKKRCGLDEALDDKKKGRTTTYASADEFFAKMGI